MVLSAWVSDQMVNGPSFNICIFLSAAHPTHQQSPSPSLPIFRILNSAGTLIQRLFFLLSNIIIMGCGSPASSLGNFELDRPEVYFVLGGPGCGKGTQCLNMVNHYKFIHLSAGDLLRAEQQRNGPFSQQIQECIKEGKVVPGELTVRLIRRAIASNGNRRYLIDGFPRNKENYSEWNKIMRDDVHVKKLLFFECSEEEMRSRIEGRAKTSGREDDNPDSVAKRFEVYKNQTLPLVQTFVEDGRIINIDAGKGKEEVYEILRAELGKNNIFPPNPVEVFFVLGGPGSGKGTQCAKLVQEYGFKHLSTGDLLREAVKEGSKEGKEIEELMREGKLVSTDILIALIKNALVKTNYTKRILLDGFPRNNENDEIWKKLMETESIVKGLIFFQCSEEVMEKRLLIRGQNSGRADDNLETIRKRFKTFTEETHPIVERYQKLGIVIPINSENSPEAVHEEVKKQLGLLNIFPKVKDYDNRPQVIFVLGGPGSGKGTQCQKMIEEFGFIHLSTGDLLREEQSKNGLIADLIIELMKQGKLVGSEVLVALVRKAIRARSWKGIYLLDGFPRSFANIAAWEQDIGNELNVRNLIYIECSQKVMEERLISRGQTSGRADDNPETIKKRFITFQKETAPIIAKYQKDGIVLRVNSQKNKDEVFNDLKESLKANGYKSVKE